MAFGITHAYPIKSLVNPKSLIQLPLTYLHFFMLLIFKYLINFGYVNFLSLLTYAPTLKYPPILLKVKHNLNLPPF